ncbi:Thylakoid lumenal kDa [Chlorella sorokiniana]|uniref:Thylakoid lumenal kDa n=1 Tax=Chlorella sorokiniana TaxID=3076 RepID=A0A2P6TRC5_CHLSO|nr:Thylakoid lumenal kDa [Chlorella sorokiniana]|eukprot:PRW56608.1 Thylakoid lumenal kDa [Chlorella sorokiniana]
MPAWEAPQGSPADAMQQFEAALRSVAPEARVVEAASSPGSEYRRFVVNDTLFDHDDIEVLIAQQQAPYETEPPLVTFRSMAAQVKYIWPIQQAVTDFGAQRQRLKEVRRRLGWRLLGCDLLECYEE